MCFVVYGRCGLALSLMWLLNAKGMESSLQLLVVSYMWRLQAAHFGGNSPAMRYRVHSAQPRYCHAMGMIEVIPWLPSRPTRGDAFTGVGHGDISVVVDVGCGCLC